MYGFLSRNVTGGFMMSTAAALTYPCPDGVQKAIS